VGRRGEITASALDLSFSDRTSFAQIAFSFYLLPPGGGRGR